MYQTMLKVCFVGLLVALPGCASKTKFLRELPPVDLLADCPEVIEKYDTNGDLVGTILDYRQALGTCNIDKESLRKWANTK
jgi:hypothetical protein